MTNHPIYHLTIDHTIPLDEDAVHAVLREVAQERRRQHAKWGQQDHGPFKWLAILLEEVGEVARAINEGHWSGADWVEYRKELIHSAAVAVSAIESFDRNGEPE
jgi:NTP pyrophosphatase (non-canonical NTP hydrolase)